MLEEACVSLNTVSVCVYQVKGDGDASLFFRSRCDEQ